MSTLSTLGRALSAPPIHWTTALPLATAGAVLGLSLHLGADRPRRDRRVRRPARPPRG